MERLVSKDAIEQKEKNIQRLKDMIRCNVYILKQDAVLNWMNTHVPQKPDIDKIVVEPDFTGIPDAPKKEKLEIEPQLQKNLDIPWDIERNLKIVATLSVIVYVIFGYFCLYVPQFAGMSQNEILAVHQDMGTRMYLAYAVFFMIAFLSWHVVFRLLISIMKKKYKRQQERKNAIIIKKQKQIRINNEKRKQEYERELAIHTSMFGAKRQEAIIRANQQTGMARAKTQEQYIEKLELFKNRKVQIEMNKKIAEKQLVSLSEDGNYVYEAYRVDLQALAFFKVCFERGSAQTINEAVRQFEEYKRFISITDNLFIIANKLDKMDNKNDRNYKDLKNQINHAKNESQEMMKELIQSQKNVSTALERNNQQLQQLRT